MGLLALMLTPPALRAFSIEDYFFFFVDIRSYPDDHWTWPFATINYKFDASFSVAFPDPEVKDEVRQAFREWSQVHSPFRGPTCSYYRYSGARKFGDIRSIILHEIGHVVTNTSDYSGAAGMDLDEFINMFRFKRNKQAIKIVPKQANRPGAGKVCSLPF